MPFAPALAAAGGALSRSGAGRWIGPALAGFALVLPAMPFSDRYIVDLGTSVLIYVMLGWGLNIVVGLAGLLDLGYVAFYAVGAYSFALLALHFDLTFWQSRARPSSARRSRAARRRARRRSTSSSRR
jgi:branched-chain amino acid transport system permease protein